MNTPLTITFLGTGTSQGVPIIGSDHPVCLSTDVRDKRLRSSVLLAWGEHRLVIDCGPDFRQQMLRAGVKRLDAVVFTHEHADHTAGIDDIRPFFFRQGDIPIYAHELVVKSLRKRFDYIFSERDRYPSAPAVQVNQIQNNRPFKIGGKPIIPIEAWHNRLQVFGFRVDGFAYLTDVKTVDESECEKLQDLDVLVVNALRIEPHHSHFNLEEALDFIEKIGPKKAYLTHISHLLGFHEAVSQQIPEHVYLAYDTLTITL